MPVPSVPFRARRAALVALVVPLVSALSPRAAEAQSVRRAAPARSESAAVRRAVLDYVEGFYEGDSTRLLRSVSPRVSKSGYWRASPDSAYHGSVMAFPEGFMRYARGVREGRNRTPPDAPKTIALLDVQDQTASAKLTAWWGTDYLLLGKENGRWMITHVLWQSTPVAAR